MAVTKKPRAGHSPLPESDIQALIEKGGSATQAGKTKQRLDKDKLQLVQLRLERGVIARIDRALESRPIKTPRHTWFLEAIFEKLAQEENKTSF